MIFRNIDKAGGLDKYVRKIKGTKEDSQGAAEMRIRLGDEKSAAAERREEMELLRAKKNADERQRAIQRSKKAAAEGRLRKRAEAEGLEESNQAPDRSTIGWFRDRIGGGFKWQ